MSIIRATQLLFLVLAIVRSVNAARQAPRAMALTLPIEPEMESFCTKQGGQVVNFQMVNGPGPEAWKFVSISDIVKVC